MHHDKLKRCDTRQLPKFIVSYKRKPSGKNADQDGNCSPERDIVVLGIQLGVADSGLNPGDQEGKRNPKPVEQVGPYMGTCKQVKERLNKLEVPSTPKRPRATKEIKSKQYCLFKT
jgi:hypothetical protein